MVAYKYGVLSSIFDKTLYLVITGNNFANKKNEDTPNREVTYPRLQS